MFIPPMNLGQFKPSPATMSQWIYQIWQFLQENPIATEEEIREFIQSEITQSGVLGNAINDYLTENPPPAPVQSVQGKTGAVQLVYNDIVTSANAVPVYKAASTPSTSTLTGQYNIGYRLFVNTTTQEIYTISPAGALSLVGRGKFDGTSIDLNTADGDTTIYEALNPLLTEEVSEFTGGGISFSAHKIGSVVVLNAYGGTLTDAVAGGDSIGTIPEGYRPGMPIYVRNVSGANDGNFMLNTAGVISTVFNNPTIAAGGYVRFTVVYFVAAST